MKKNWMLRLGLLAMVLTLVTMPMVSSTYAKYVSEKTGTASARVAQWGVTVETDFDDLFGDAYAVGANSVAATWSATPSAASVTVNADTEDEFVFAPGTTGSFTFTLTGKPEVALNLAVSATVGLTGWTVSGSAYEPITFTLYNGANYYDGTAWGAVETPLSADLLQAGLLTLNQSSAVNPNTDLAKITNASATGVYTVTWQWPYTNSAGAGATWLFLNTGLYTSDGTNYTAAGSTYDSGKTYYTESGGAYTAVTNMAPYLVTYDEADTALGMAANGTTPSLSISLTITATQIN